MNIYFSIMSKNVVPPGWTRKKVDKRIVYICDPPRVHIWNIKDFDNLKRKGRFPTVSRETLSFSTKVRRFLSLSFHILFHLTK
jgi:hypothetical protein